MDTSALTDEFYQARREDLKGRVDERRLLHIDGVASTAQKLAEVYGVDVAEARLAGLLHDWDKNMDDDRIRARARELDMEDELGTWVIDNMPLVLHGPTAAKALHAQFPEIPGTVIDAIRKHTTASTDMTDLDKVIYIADAIEPSRRFDIVDELRALIGEVPLDELYYDVYKFWTIALVQHDKVLHPDTMKIWNAIACERQDRLRESREQE